MPRKKGTKEEAPLKLFYIFYSKERMENWIRSLQELSFAADPSSEEPPEGLLALSRFAEDITIEVLKIVKLFQNGRFTKEEALQRMREVEAIVMSEVRDGEIGDVLESLQLSLLVLFSACRMVMDGRGGGDVKALVKRARALPEGDMEGSLEIAGEIGAAVIGGSPCCEKYMADDPGKSTLLDDWLVEIETMKEAMKSLKDFDETTGEED
ncbi:MAG: DUF2150 family protein [Methanomicrobiales archaeon]|nr:DUF2150 family protein [Methanomicrobiales archaeon]MDD1661206.1 DUF2150 family protein [Methanomicrobiales archaeon]